MGLTALAMLFGPLLSDTALGGDNSYRWVDDDGEVHYGDRLPAAQAKKEHEVVDDSGVVRERYDPEASKDNNASKEDEASDVGKGEETKDARRDQVLRQQFPNEEALIETRERRLQGVQSRIDLTRQNIERLESARSSRLEYLEALPEDSAKRDQTEEQLEEIERRLERQHDHLANLKKEKERLRRQFQADLERFRELEAREDD